MRRHHILILCAALIATLPLFLYGCSCGHDIDFHIQSWLDAAHQLRHGTVQPHWIFSGAWNAGEPRFVFYPPLSWMSGAALSLIFPAHLLPAIYTFLVLAAAGFAMHRLAQNFVSPNAALVAATLYVVNPYMMFNAFERSAYAELLAAVWLPLLFLAALRERPTVRGIALPVALLWLTNAPAAVMGTYTLALIGTVRILYILITQRSANKQDTTSPLHLALTSIYGAALGLALSAFYLVPAAYERRFVQIAMAIIPNMRFQDNFLFGHTADADHNRVLHTASLLAVSLLIATAAMLLILHLRKNLSSRPERAARSGEIAAVPPATILTVLTLTIAFLLTPLSTPLWNHVPELAFLQFPWRLLSVLAVVLALSIGLLLRNTTLRTRFALPLALCLAAALSFLGIHEYRQRCDLSDLPATRAQLFLAHQGVDPTDEYTPTIADNDVLRADDPPYWLSPNPAAFPPGTTPNPATFVEPQTAPPDNVSATAAPPSTTPPTFAPASFTIIAAQPGFLILNLRQFPSWHIQVNRRDTSSAPRDDGLFAIPVGSGVSTVDITWHRSLDQKLGIALSLIALCIYAWLIFRAAPGRIEV